MQTVFTRDGDLSPGLLVRGRPTTIESGAPYDIGRKISVIVYHGSNQESAELTAGSWITTDLDTAWHFALLKVSEQNGEAVVLAVEISDDDVDWDVLSMAAGVEDERGVLIKPVAAVAIPRVSVGNGL
jgi:hypothetical protein